MSSQIQMKPPLPVPVSASWSPSSKKENLDEAVPLDKRRRIVALGKMAGTTANPRMSRQVPSSVNTGPSPVDQAVVGTNAGSSAGGEFESREDMESLLNEKMKGKHKNDFKVRICIRWYMELEDGYLEEKEKLRSMLDSEEKRQK